MKLIYSQNSGSITNATGTWQITAAPVLGFAFDGIFYDDENEHSLKYVGAGRIDLTGAERETVRQYLIAVVMPVITPPTAAQVLAAQRATMQPLSAWQIRKALTAFNMRIQVETTIAAASLDLQDAWHYASEFKRDDPVLLAAAASLGLTDIQLDNMFTIGATL